jgi:hypothetical protein
MEGAGIVANPSGMTTRCPHLFEKLLDVFRGVDIKVTLFRFGRMNGLNRSPAAVRATS